MDNYKILTKKGVAILTSLSLASLLIGCTPKKENNVEDINQDNQTIEQKIETYTQETIEDQEYEETEEYIDSLKEDLKECKKIVKDKCNSKQTQEKIENIKEKSKMLYDFIFNGEEINGYTFDELSEEERESIIKSYKEVDNLIEQHVPNYKEETYDFFVDRGVDAKETWEKIKEKYKDYKNDVEEKYYSNH